MNATQIKRVGDLAPMVLVIGVNGYRALLECGHTATSRARPEGPRLDDASIYREPLSPRKRKCLDCLRSWLYGPYLCSVHPECRTQPKGTPKSWWIQMRAECWNESAKGRPTVADVIYARLDAIEAEANELGAYARTTRYSLMEIQSLFYFYDGDIEKVRVTVAEATATGKLRLLPLTIRNLQRLGVKLRPFAHPHEQKASQ